MQAKYPKIGICGISCRLCFTYHIKGASKCNGCKNESRTDASCPLQVCAITQKNIEFCWQCPDNAVCEILNSPQRDGCDAILPHQKVDINITLMKRHGIAEFDRTQQSKGKLLEEMLRDYNEEYSAQIYCAAASILDINELEATLTQAWIDTKGMGPHDKSECLRSLLNRTYDSKCNKTRLNKMKGELAL